jgi:tetratricopeptide (TPR) repeat protein
LGGFAFVYYLKRLLLIEGFNPMLKYPETDLLWNFTNIYFVYAVIAVIIVGICVYLIYRFRKQHRLLVLGLLIFLINISIVMHIIPIDGRVVAADRYTYPSYWGLFLIAAYFITKIRKNRIVVQAALVVLPVSLFAYTSYINIPDWENSVTLWQQGVAKDSENHYAYYILGLAYFVEEYQPEKAIENMNKALNLSQKPEYYNNRGRIHFALGNIYQAMSDFDAAIQLDTTSFAAYNNQGAVLLNMCRFNEAHDYFIKALQYYPEYVDAQVNLAKVDNLMFLDSIVWNRDDLFNLNKMEVIDFIVQTAQRLTGSKNYNEAERYILRGLLFDSSNADLYASLGVNLFVQGKFRQAIDAYSKGLQYHPNNIELLLGRGMAYLETGSFVDACVDWNLAASFGDKDAEYMIANYCN